MTPMSVAAASRIPGENRKQSRAEVACDIDIRSHYPYRLWQLPTLKIFR